MRLPLVLPVVLYLTGVEIGDGITLLQMFPDYVFIAISLESYMLLKSQIFSWRIVRESRNNKIGFCCFRANSVKSIFFWLSGIALRQPWNI
jgi:hypothetical protein